MIITRKDTKRKRYFGITKEARRLGVTVPHLWQVLTGRRVSGRIMREVRIAEAAVAGLGAEGAQEGRG